MGDATGPILARGLGFEASRRRTGGHRLSLEGMADPAPSRPDSPWYLATSEAEQAAVLDGLARAGAGSDGAPLATQLAAVSALIELCHLTAHPGARASILRALGRCTEQFIAIPALHAELDSPHTEVVVAALQAIGAVGLANGGALVARWLALQAFDELDGAVFDAAAMALAQTGHPDAGKVVADGWRRGLIASDRAHLVAAEAVSPELLDRAPEHLSDPTTAQAAALHLVALGAGPREALFAPLLSGGDTGLALLAEHLLRLPELPVDDHVLQVLTAKLPPTRLSRLARSLRAHPPEAVVAGFATLAADLDPNGSEAGGVVRASLSAGIPELQDVAVHLAACGSPRGLAHALYRVHSPTPSMRRWLDEWTTHTDSNVAKSAVRARLNLFGLREVGELACLADSPRAELRLEWARLQQNAFRDKIDDKGRSTLGHAQRSAIAATLTRLIRGDTDLAVRELAAYTAGNIGLTELGDELGRQLATSPEWRLRRAAATALAEFSAPGQLSVLTEALASEASEEVLFRIARALLRVAGEGGTPLPAVAALAAERLGEASPRCRVLLVSLIGKCGSAQHVDLVTEAAHSRGLALAIAAIAALGDLGDDRGLDAVLAASEAPSPSLRWVATEALGRIGGEVALDRLADLLMNADEDVELRRVALAGLENAALSAEIVARLAPDGLDDPLAVGILQLRLRATAVPGTGAGGGVRPGVEDIDRRLAGEIPGFVAARLEQRHRGALQALRTAEYFYLPGSSLPPGLDAAPPAIFWVKGLELWLDDLLTPMMRDLVRPPGQREVAALAARWAALRGTVAPGWRDDWIDPAAGDLFARLGEDAAKEFARPISATRVFGLRSVAVGLLLAGQGAASGELAAWGVGIGLNEAAMLANRLVALAAHRNRFTHRLAGTASDHPKVREVALACAAVIVRLKVGR